MSYKTISKCKLLMLLSGTLGMIENWKAISTHLMQFSMEIRVMFSDFK